MKVSTLIALALGLGAFAVTAQAQPGGGPGGPRGGGRPPMPPIITALDANTNGVIETAELANASQALLTLDKDGNGKLSSTELQPQRSGGGNQPQFTPPNDGKRPSPPIVSALDTNSDGELSGSEIAGAPTALKALDADGDGQLSRDELRPSPAEGFGGPGGENPPPGE